MPSAFPLPVIGRSRNGSWAEGRSDDVPAEVEFIDKSGEHAAGFYWGKPPEELGKSTTIPDAMMLGWLEFFEKKGQTLRPGEN